MWSSTMKDLAIPESVYPHDEPRKAQGPDLDGKRAQAAAPPEVSRHLRITAQAAADARPQSATHDLCRIEGRLDAEELALSTQECRQ